MAGANLLDNPFTEFVDQLMQSVESVLSNKLPALLAT
jgi:hypothetical protein